LESISWPSFRETPEMPVVPKFLELNPHKFDVKTDLFKNVCDGFWKPYFN
jgi:hypothetical protein